MTRRDPKAHGRLDVLPTATRESGVVDLPASCECDNTHEQNDTVCRWCWANGRRKWNDPEVAE